MEYVISFKDSSVISGALPERYETKFYRQLLISGNITKFTLKSKIFNMSTEK